MSDFSRESPEVLLARNQKFINEFCRDGLSMIERLNALNPRPKPAPLSDHEKMIRNLDYQHERVRDAYAVLRGEIGIE